MKSTDLSQRDVQQLTSALVDLHNGKPATLSTTQPIEALQTLLREGHQAALQNTLTAMVGQMVMRGLILEEGESLKASQGHLEEPIEAMINAKSHTSSAFGSNALIALAVVGGPMAGIGFAGASIGSAGLGASLAIVAIVAALPTLGMMALNTTRAENAHTDTLKSALSQVTTLFDRTVSASANVSPAPSSSQSLGHGDNHQRVEAHVNTAGDPRPTLDSGAQTDVELTEHPIAEAGH